MSPAKNQPNHDLVYTPRSLSKEIIDYYKPSGLILDPCKGNGSFYDQYPDHCDKDWCELELKKDFFDYENKVDWIITNPPWSKIKVFLDKSMDISNNIVFLITITHVVTRHRAKMIYEKGFGIKEIYAVDHPKLNWPQSGFLLAAIHLKKDWKGDCNLSGLFNKWKVTH